MSDDDHDANSSSMDTDIHVLAYIAHVTEAPIVEMTDEHARNIGFLVYAMAHHETGDYGDCSINDPIMNLIDMRRPAHEVIAALTRMPHENAHGILGQLYDGGRPTPAATVITVDRELLHKLVQAAGCGLRWQQQQIKQMQAEQEPLGALAVLDLDNMCAAVDAARLLLPAPAWLTALSVPAAPSVPADDEIPF